MSHCCGDGVVSLYKEPVRYLHSTDVCSCKTELPANAWNDGARCFARDLPPGQI